jgi:hypothetical protein
LPFVTRCPRAAADGTVLATEGRLIMAKLIYQRPRRSTARWQTRTASSTGRRRTRRYTASSTTSSSGSAPYLYGRRTYKTMLAWETMPLDDQPVRAPRANAVAERWRK